MELHSFVDDCLAVGFVVAAADTAADLGSATARMGCCFDIGGIAGPQTADCRTLVRPLL